MNISTCTSTTCVAVVNKGGALTTSSYYFFGSFDEVTDSQSLTSGEGEKFLLLLPLLCLAQYLFPPKPLFILQIHFYPWTAQGLSPCVFINLTVSEWVELYFLNIASSQTEYYCYILGISSFDLYILYICLQTVYYTDPVDTTKELYKYNHAVFFNLINSTHYVSNRMKVTNIYRYTRNWVILWQPIIIKMLFPSTQDESLQTCFWRAILNLCQMISILLRFNFVFIQVQISILVNFMLNLVLKKL